MTENGVWYFSNQLLDKETMLSLQETIHELAAEQKRALALNKGACTEQSISSIFSLSGYGLLNSFVLPKLL